MKTNRKKLIIFISIAIIFLLATIVIPAVSFWKKSYYIDMYTGYTKIESSTFGIKSSEFTGQNSFYKAFDEYLEKGNPPKWLLINFTEGGFSLTGRGSLGKGSICIDYLNFFYINYDKRLGKERTKYYLNLYMHEMYKDAITHSLALNTKVQEILEDMKNEINLISPQPPTN